MNIALIGCGGIGCSLTLALKRAGRAAVVVGFDRDAGRAKAALKQGAIDKVAADVSSAVKAAELVIVAVPVGATAEVCRAMAATLRDQAVVTDVGSTKVEVQRVVGETLPQPSRFVGAHPIAGTERSGPEAANADLFRGRTCVICPLPSTATAAVAVVRELWEAVGAKLRSMDAAEHDQLLALTSHLPHAAVFALMAALEGQPLSGLSAGGLQDTTRIAASDPVMWRDIFLTNTDPVIRAIDRVTEELGRLRAAIAANDGAAIERLIDRARRARRELE